MCVWRNWNSQKNKKKQCFWSEERVSNKLKQNWGINHDWSGGKVLGPRPLEQVRDANDVIYCRSLKDNVHGMSPCACVCVGAVFHTWIAIVNEPYTKLSKQNRNVIKTIGTSKNLWRIPLMSKVIIKSYSTMNIYPEGFQIKAINIELSVHMIFVDPTRPRNRNIYVLTRHRLNIILTYLWWTSKMGKAHGRVDWRLLTNNKCQAHTRNPQKVSHISLSADVFMHF